VNVELGMNGLDTDSFTTASTVLDGD